jgi:hypothetical protein
MVKEFTIKDAIIDHYKKPYDKITKEEKDKFYSMVFPCYKMDLSESEKEQVENLSTVI